MLVGKSTKLYKALVTTTWKNNCRCSSFFNKLVHTCSMSSKSDHLWYLKWSYEANLYVYIYVKIWSKLVRERIIRRLQLLFVMWCCEIRIWSRLVGQGWSLFERLGSSWGLFGSSWEVLGPLGAFLGPTGGLLGSSWNHLGAILEPSWEPSWSHFPVILPNHNFLTA